LPLRNCKRYNEKRQMNIGGTTWGVFEKG